MRAMLLALLALAGVGWGCATTKGGGPLEAAEQTIQSSFDVTGKLIQADDDAAAPCRAANVEVTAQCSRLEGIVPGAHKLASDLRRLYPPVLDAANTALVAYRDAIAVQSAMQATKSATPDQLAAANAVANAAHANLNKALANLEIYTFKAEAAWSKWMGHTH
jgi:hypothetical protein